MQPTRTIPSIMLAALVAFGATAATAGHDVKSLSVRFDETPGTIEVANNGTEFHHVTNGGGPWGKDIAYKVAGSVECAWRADLSRYRLAGPASGTNRVANPLEVKGVGKNGSPWLIWMPLSAVDPVGACNREVAKQVAAGKEKWLLLKHGFKIWASHSVGLGASCLLRGHKPELVDPDYFPPQSNASWKVVTDTRSGAIQCKGNPSVRKPLPPGPDSLTLPFAVTEVTLTANPSTQTAYSKGNVNLQGAITVTGVRNRHDVLYRMVHNGAYGPVRKMTFIKKSGTGNIGVPLEIPCTAPPPGDTRVTPGGGGGQGIGGLTTPTAPGQKSGYARLVIVQPTNGVRKSNDAFYKVNCKKTPNQAPNLPDLVIQGASLSDGKLKAVVRNTGASGAPATQLKVFIQSGMGRQVKQAPIPALAVSTSVEVEVNVGPLAGPTSFVLHADNPAKVKELSENNNVYRLN